MFSLPKAGLILGLALSAYAADITPETAKKLNQIVSTWQKPANEKDTVIAKLLLAQLDSFEANLQRQAEAGRSRRVGDNAQAVAAYKSGTRLANLGHKQEALQSFSEALRIDPSYYPAHFGRAKIFLLLAMWTEAHAEVKKE